ncbi:MULTISPECIES: GntR family transcriptional regulator [unclassified Cryobacterium]|uniref:GntR family transcriptional regulator n=1 Tax=unclassified Cryobacterium TaxID=2649013 RepID=UPI001445B015|nr:MULTISPECIES: GntR family transcriptional regulator [unclassified Cryobacterium]
MLLRIDAASDVPIFDQLAAGIRTSAISGAVAPGERLPSAKELARTLDVNVHTVLHAYQVLRDEGIIDLRPGRGATVTDRASEYAKLNAAINVVVTEARELDIHPAALTALIREAYQ